MSLSGDDREEIPRSLRNFFEDENIVQQWCQHTPAAFFTKAKSEDVSEFMTLCYYHPDPEGLEFIRYCASSRHKKGQEFWLPVAKVHAKNGLHGDWDRNHSLQVIFQIKNLVYTENAISDTRGNLSQREILETVEWAESELITRSPESSLKEESSGLGEKETLSSEATQSIIEA